MTRTLIGWKLCANAVWKVVEQCCCSIASDW